MTRTFYDKKTCILPVAALCLLVTACETARAPVVSAPLYPHQRPYEGTPFPMDEMASRKTGGSVRIYDVYGAYTPPAYVPYDHNARQVGHLMAAVPPSSAVQAVRGPVSDHGGSAAADTLASGTSEQPLRAKRYGASVVERSPPGKNYN